MFNRIALLAATALLATACASNPAPAGGAVSAGGAVPLTPGAGTTVTVANMAATTHWLADERLMPQDPLLALVNNSSNTVDSHAGVLISCNAANGKITARLGKQSATRVGQSATYSLRTGAGARPLEGKFETNPKSPDADFVFPLVSADLIAMGQLDMISVLTDQGEAQWAFVKDPAAQVQAKYVGSLKDLSSQARDFIEFCNPK